LDVPGELSVEVRLENEIDWGKSMVGDEVTAVLERPLRKKGRVVLPGGATLAGRIVRLQRLGEECVLDVRFTEAHSKEVRWNLFAHIAEIRVLNPAFAPDRLERSFVPKRKPEVGTMYIRGRVHLPRGARIVLRTEDTAADRESHSAPL
jgi:hypothetical protein